MVMMVSSLAQRAATGRALAPAAAPRVLTPQTIRPIVLRRYKEGEQADTSGQGSKAPRNPLTGQRLTPVSNPQKEGYQATEQIPQSEATSARINQQLGAQPGGRPFGGKQRTWDPSNLKHFTSISPVLQFSHTTPCFTCFFSDLPD